MSATTTSEHLSTNGRAADMSTLPADVLQAVEQGQALLVTTPHASSAASIAEHAIGVARDRGRRVFYTSPNEALALRRQQQLQAILGPAELGLLTKAVSHHPEASLVVGTPAALRAEFFARPDRFQDAGYVIFDDVDLLSDPEQETAWEELVLQLPSEVSLLCLSAPVGNAVELADWLTQVRGATRLWNDEQRVVPVQHLLLRDSQLHQLVGSDGIRASEVPPVGGEARRPRPLGTPPGAQPQEAPDAAEVVWVLRREALLPAIYFLPGQRNCEQRAAECSQSARRGQRALQRRRQSVVTSYLDSLPAEDRELAQVRRLTGLIEQGVAVYHAGLLPPLKSLVEALLDAGLLDVVFATDAMANESNVSARAVVVGDPTVLDRGARRSLGAWEYARLARSAGRPGSDDLASVVNVYSPWVSAHEVQALATAHPESFQSTYRPRLQSAALLAGDNSTDNERVGTLMRSTLRRHQTNNAVRRANAAADSLRHAVAELTFDCPVPGVEEAALGEYQQLRRDAGRLRREASQQAFQLLRLRGAVAGSEGGAGAPEAEISNAEQAAQAAEEEAKRAALESHAFPCHTCTVRREHELIWRRRAAAEKDLQAALAEVQSLETEATAQNALLAAGLLGALQRYAAGNGSLSTKTTLLSRIDHPAGLVLAEAMWQGHLDNLPAGDLMEALSWFCNDRDTPGYNRYFLSARLWEARKRLQALVTELEDHDDEGGSALVLGPNPMFHGPVHDWCRGASLGSILEKMDVAEGDLVGTLHRTLDLARQLRKALADAAASGDGEWAERAQLLQQVLERGKALVRRGIVARSAEALTTGTAATGEPGHAT